MNLYEAVYSRKSVRKFRTEPLPQEILERLLKAVKNTAALDPQGGTELAVYDNTKAAGRKRSLHKNSAPYYLLVYCGEGKSEARNAGYVAEQIVLYLTSKGIATCYQASAKVGDAEKNGKKRLLCVAFGYAEGTLTKGAAEARRLPLTSLCVFKDEAAESVKTILNAARLAPSSYNSQPWRFIVYTDRIYIFSKKDLLPQSKQAAALREFNIGIMLSHIMVAAEELWVNLETVTEEQFLKKVYKNGEYICTIVFHL